jgi:hypothetical protein
MTGNFNSPKGEIMLIRKKSHRWWLGLAFGVALVGGASASRAGNKWPYPLTIDLNSGWAQGALGTVRNSANGSEYMSCFIASYGINCGAFDGTRNLSCYHPRSKSNYSVMLATVQSLSGDSLLQFKAASDGTCAELIVNNGSYWEPKR